MADSTVPLLHDEPSPLTKVKGATKLVGEAAKDVAFDMKYGVKSAASGLAHAAHNVKEDIKEGATEMGEAIKGKAEVATDRISEFFNEVAEGAKLTAEIFIDDLRKFAEGVSSTASEAMEGMQKMGMKPMGDGVVNPSYAITDPPIDLPPPSTMPSEMMIGAKTHASSRIPFDDGLPKDSTALHDLSQPLLGLHRRSSSSMKPAASFPTVIAPEGEDAGKHPQLEIPDSNAPALGLLYEVGVAAPGGVPHSELPSGAGLLEMNESNPPPPLVFEATSDSTGARGNIGSSSMDTKPLDPAAKPFVAHEPPKVKTGFRHRKRRSHGGRQSQGQMHNQHGGLGKMQDAVGRDVESEHAITTTKKK